ncbi:conserved hypothetical protein [Alteracholeplasma palmae J233]|uniref:Permuted papain-like amidase enzyme, YaeF/YiiX, C92 family n=1 Tax=Alteracholeplasma palmae (strain ATCC 49389 / J233) TaxID=1318466 RepID=U4KLW2_ALTPJ|nr:hypothetical protein [Alteracholeplasma palmae]CCV65014.1 conserved hypothetical protein [Alteracholeplasma palmae J233]
MKIKKILKFLIYIALGGLSYSFGIATYENMKVNQIIKEFKSQMVEKTRTEENGQTIIYYVPRETPEGEKPSFSDSTKKKVGQKGDILVTQESPFPEKGLIHSFVSYYFGGHAALVTDSNQLLEVAGFGNASLLELITHDGNNPEHDYTQTVDYSSNYFFDSNYRSTYDPSYPYYGASYRKKFIGLRVNNITDKQIDEVIEEGQKLVDKKAVYNYLFFLDTKFKYYCSDLVSRLFQTQNHLTLNDDGFITSINDLILSKDTRMFFYTETIDNVQHIYYFE